MIYTGKTDVVVMNDSALIMLNQIFSSGIPVFIRDLDDEERFNIRNDVIQSKLRFLQEYLQDLAEYRSITLSAYTASKKDQRFVERTLHRFAGEVLGHVAST